MVHAARAAAHAGPDDQLAAIIDAVLQTTAEQPQIIAMHLRYCCSPAQQTCSPTPNTTGKTSSRTS
jgi:hypothetical protein